MEELKSIVLDGGCLSIGALVTHADLASDRLIRDHAAALAEAASVIGSPQIRNRGTVGGNLVNASPAGDTVGPLVALDADLILMSTTGPRTVPAARFADGPGATVLREDELLATIRLKADPDRLSGYARLGARRALACAKVSVALAARRKSDGPLTDVRVALGAVAPTVVRSGKAETELEGKQLEEPVIARAVEAVKRDVSPIDDIRSTAEYRKEMCGVLLDRLLSATRGGE